jgi:hypothetical protein
MIGLLVHDEFEMIRKEVVIVSSRYYPSIWTEGLRKSTKIVFEIAGVLTEIRTEYFPNASLVEHYREANWFVSSLGSSP